MRDQAGGDEVRAAASVWAKSWPRNGPSIERWLPLWQHLDDTADVAGMLVDTWLAPSVIHLLAECLPGGSDDARRLVTWVAGVHDVGKASPAFAIGVPILADLAAPHGLRIGSMVKEDHTLLRHEIAGAAALERWLAARGVARSTRRQLTCLVAGHHGSFPTYPMVQDAPAREYLAGDEAWRAVQDLLLDRAAVRAGVLDRLDGWSRLDLPPAALMAISGVVVMADWIASGDDHFPLVPIGEIPTMPQPRSGPGRRAEAAWPAVGLGGRWRPAPPAPDASATFRDRFPWAGGGPRPLQLRAAERAMTMPTPGLMIIEAPMGVGKTEAALMAVEVLAERTGATGCFVALPTQATSNAMFARVLGWLERVPDGSGIGEQTVALVHGKAALNDDLRRLRPLGSSPGLVYGDDADGDGGVQRLRAAASEWARGRKRAALSSFVVGTIDQVLFAALKARHVMLRQLSLMGKVVVIDEVHAADIFMSTFLDLALEWLGAAGTPVVLLTATLPAERRAALWAAYERGRRARRGAEPGPDSAEGGSLLLDRDIGYPSIVTSGLDGPVVDTVDARTEASEVEVLRLDDSLDVLAALLDEKLADGGCAVVVRNTVRRAQETAAFLAARFGERDVTVAHAQFLAADRIRNDDRLVRRFGPPSAGAERPWRHIVVATQVVEQSLDLDFDLMVTDAAPVDLVLQRIGRLHRHERVPGQADRPALLRRARCYVTGVDWGATPPRPDGGGAAVYGLWPLLRALAVLDTHLDGVAIRLPQDIARLVQAAYGNDAPEPPSWRAAVDEAWDAYRREQEERQSRAAQFALPRPGRLGTNLYGLSWFGVGNVDEDSPEGQACVRDGGDSIEVVVVQRGADGADRVPDWVAQGEELPLRHVEVPYAQARLLARCTVRLPAALARGATGDAVVKELEQNYFEGWQRSAFLSGQLALVLDDDRTARLHGRPLVYDLRRGLLLGPRDQEMSPPGAMVQGWGGAEPRTRGRPSS